MPRDLPIGNERLLLLFDEDWRLRDLYYPAVGKENHLSGNANRFGIFVDGRFSWVSRATGWKLSRKYADDTLVTDVEAIHEELGLRLRGEDCVDFHEALYLRRLEITDLTGRAREVRVYFHHDFDISESDVGDTAVYEPRSRTITHYKGRRYLLANLMVDGRAGVERFATGQKGNGKEGTWRDAEDDGNLSLNPIAQGAVDSVIATAVLVPAGATKVVWYWLAVAEAWQGSWDAAQELNQKVVTRGPDEFLRRTRAFWQLWARKEPTTFFELSPSLVALYKRSLLVIRTQIDGGGGIIAANDSDITSFARDTYSYVWPRDGALVAHAMDMAGYPEVARKFFHFCADVITPEGYLLHKYNPDRSLASSWHPWVAPPTGAQPDVVLGAPQLPIQEDETALVLWAMWRHFLRYRDLDAMKPLYGRYIRKAGDFLVSYREPRTGLPAPSYDLWEERRGILSFTCAAVHAGLMAAHHFAAAFGEDAVAARYKAGADEIRQGMDAFLWRPELGRFARMINVRGDGSLEVDGTIDASLYGLFAFGAYPARDPRVEGTMQAVRDKLWVQTPVGGVARYENDPYHRATPEVPGNPWFICTMWLALWEIARAERAEELEDALKVLGWVDEHRLPSGVLAEQVHPLTGAPLSVSPLTWSHATVIEVVQSYLEKREALERCPTCGGPRHRKIEGYERRDP